jgi:hypothetical protein
MSTTGLIVALVVAAVLVALGAWLWLKRRRSETLRARFGPEYERTVRQEGNPARAEQVLEDRARKVAAFRIRALTGEEAARYREAWRRVQARFVDEPTAAVIDADRLIADVMHSRGYPTTDVDARTEALSVDHARTVDHYRAAHHIVERQDSGEAGTEELRQAMVHYRALFQDLVGTEDPALRKRA